MKILIVLLIIFCVSCATGYKPAGSGSTIEGYEESKLTSDSYRVKYTGTNTLQNYKFFLRRAAELASKSGFQYFSVRDAHQGELKRGMGNIGAGEFKVPYYEGTVLMSKGAKTVDGFSASEILAEHK